MSHGPNDEIDPFDDPFGFGSYNPTLEFALTAAEQAKEKLEIAEDLVPLLLSTYASRQNPIAASARKALQLSFEELRAAVAMCGFDADVAAHSEGGSGVQRKAADNAIRAYDEVVRLTDEMAHIISAVPSEDAPENIAAPKPLPATQSWAQVAAKTQSETLAWIQQVRGQTGQLLILKPSPSTGKTRAMIYAAYNEQAARRRVTMSSRVKGVLVDELAPRIRQGKPYVRLHVVTGRDEENCLNFENVQAVQAHGYAPGQAVCIGCDHYPRNAYPSGMPVCEYYASRMRARNDSQAARRGQHEYPIIATTHAGLVSAFQTGGGQYGSFWASHTIFVDEDPTEALEPTVALTPSQATFSSTRVEDRPVSLFARVCEKAFEIAEEERGNARHWGYKLRDLGGRVTKEPDPVHSEHGSAYAAQDLHALMEQAYRTVVRGLVKRDVNAQHMLGLLRDVADHHYTPPAGSLWGATDPSVLNMLVPPVGLARVAETIYNELTLEGDLQAFLYQLVHSTHPSGDATEIHDKLASRTEVGRTSYAVRLEHGKTGWQFVVQDAANLRSHDANIVVGDAYAHEEHYRQLFHKPSPTDGNADPVTLLDLVAHFPSDTTLLRIQTKSTIGYLEKGNFQINEALLESALARFRGKRVLLYGHQSWMRPRVESMMSWAADKYGIVEWAYEHWWGGRGKDQYKDFDACIVVSEPVFNIGAMLHTVNARAFRTALRSPDAMEKLEHGRRIGFEPSTHGLAQAFRKAHWRLRQEHERMNENELAQAIHRVRPLINPRTVVLMGNSLDLSRDLLAGTVTVQPSYSKEAPPSEADRGALVENAMQSFLSLSEIERSIEAILEWHGVCGTIFTHALFQWDLLHFLSERQSEVETDDPDSERRVWSLTNCKLTGSSAPSDGFDRGLLTLPDRVWNPPVQWERLNARIKAHGHRARRAMADVKKRCRHTGFYRPSWYVGPGPGYGFFSNAGVDKLAVRGLFREILECQYGPVVDGKLYTPRAKPMPSSWKEMPF